MALQPPEGGTPTHGAAPGLQAQWFARQEKREAPRFFWNFDDSVGTVSFMPPRPTTHPDLEALFEFIRSRVTEEDIRWNVPNDPGSQEYRDLWKGIWRTGSIPRGYSVALDEVVNLNRWTNHEEQQDPESFRRFRRFNNAVDLVILEWDLTAHYGENYLAYSLLEDLMPDDAPQLALLRRAFAAAARILQKQKEPAEYPFFVFGEMLLAQRAGDFSDMSEAAARLIVAEEAVWMNDEIRLPFRSDGRFLFCLTGYVQFEQKWLELAAKLENPENDPHIARVMHLLAGGSR